MKRTAIRNRKVLEVPTAWRESEYAALRASAIDVFDDRFGENSFDAADERAEVDIIVNGMIHGAN